MKSNFLDKELTDFVQGYLDSGYTLNTATMSGSDGTRRVDLRKGNKFIRVWIDRQSIYSYNKEIEKKYKYYGDVFVLRVGYIELKYTDTDHVWSNDLAISYEKPYYKIGDRGYDKGAITDDFEDVKHWMAVSYPRNQRRYEGEKNSRTYDDIKRLRIGLNIVKKMPKTKSIHLENITYITRSRDYNGRLVYTVNYVSNSGVGHSVSVRAKSF